ncbi:MAG: hypothetical protein ACTSO7_00380 [Candidatus Heimdallarchaeota archaeon]
MSQYVTKAQASEEKGKWKNAAADYYEAAKEFRAQGNAQEANGNYLKAIENAEKAKIPTFLIEITFSFVEIAKKDDKKSILTKVIPLLDEQIKLAETKKKISLIIELLEKKVNSLKEIGTNVLETQIMLCENLLQSALKKMVSKKDEDRLEGMDKLAKATDILIEIDDKDRVADTQLEAFKALMTAGFMTEGLQLLDTFLEFCSNEKFPAIIDKILLQFMSFCEDIMLAKGMKKLAATAKETLSETNPGGALLDKAIEKAKEVQSKVSLIRSTEILANYANYLITKKKTAPISEYFDKALKIVVDIEDVDASIKIGDELIKIIYNIMDQKGRFTEALDLFSLLEQLEKVNLPYIGEKMFEKAEQMFTRNQIKIALDDYLKASKSYLLAEEQGKFEEISTKVFTQAIELIKTQKLTDALMYIESIVEVLEEIDANVLVGQNLTQIVVELIKANQIKEAEHYSIKTVEDLMKAGDEMSAAKAHRLIGEALIGLEIFENASLHLIEASRIFKSIEKVSEIYPTLTPLLIAAKNQLAAGNLEIAKQLIDSVSQCARQKDPITESTILLEFVEQAISYHFPEIALESVIQATNILGRNFPEELVKIVEKSKTIGNRLITADKNYALGKLFLENAIAALVNLEKNDEGAKILIEGSQNFFDNEQHDLAKEMLTQITKVLNSEKAPEEYAEKVSQVGRMLINYNFIDDGLEQLRKSVGSYLSQGIHEPVLVIADYCTQKAKQKIKIGENIHAKYLFISAMEFSSLIDLEEQDKILTEATSLFLEGDDLYTLQELYDYASTSLDGEKDYLAKLGRLIVVQGAWLRDKKQLFEESSDMIRNGIKILNQNEMVAESGEVAINQGYTFVEMGNFVIGEELIETGAEIFIKINDINRSGEAFLALTDLNIRRDHWEDALRQVKLAIKSFTEIGKIDNLKIAILKTAEIGAKSLSQNPETNRDFSNECFKLAITSAQAPKLTITEIDVYVLEATVLAEIKDYNAALLLYQQATMMFEEIDEKVKSVAFSETLSNLANITIAENNLEAGSQFVDLAAGTFMRLGQPLKASEVYMKSCNSLLKVNNVVEAVKLVLLASDTLMVANELEQAAKILVEIVELLFGMKDYQHASIVTGQIVTVHQQTGNVEEQKKAIYKIVEKAQEVIKEGQIVEGEKLWEQVANYSLSISLEYATEINNLRIENLMAANMYNSTNNAFKHILSVVGDDQEQLNFQGDRITNIALGLFENKEYDLAKNFIITAIEFYRKANNAEKARNLCLTMSSNYISKGDQQNGIDMIDQAASISNDLEGAHEAAKVYLSSGFVLIESGFTESGKLSIKKAMDIEIQAQNTQGCLELGEMTLIKGAELEKSDVEKSIEIYSMAGAIYECAKAYVKAGEACVIIASKYINTNNAHQALVFTEKAVDFYMKGSNVDLAYASAKQLIESSRRLLSENEVTKAVLILEKALVFVEKIKRIDLYSLIISIYLNAATSNLPNRKSAIGIFFLNRAMELAKSTPDPEEIKKVVDYCLKLSLEIIRKKNSLAGAKVLEIAAKQDIAFNALQQQTSDTYLEAVKLTIDTEWNMIGKATRDGLIYFKKLQKSDYIAEMLSIITKRANADIITNKPVLGFFFLEQAIKLAKESENPEHLISLGTETFAQLQLIDPEIDMETGYRLLGYIYQLFNDLNSMEHIENIGKEFVKFGSKDLIKNLYSLRGYDAILTARDISVQSQNQAIMNNVVLALLDFAFQASTKNSRTTFSALKDIIDGLESFEVPHTTRVTLDYETIKEYIKSLTTFGEKLAKNNLTETLGNQIVQCCYRILILSKNESAVLGEIDEVTKNLQKYIRKSNAEAANAIRQTGIMLIDLNQTDRVNDLAENCFRNADLLYQKKKYKESISFLEATLDINRKLEIDSELKNIGMFALNSGDRIAREGKIPESMTFYDIAIEAFDYAKDEESSSRIINMIFQTREWDSDETIAYKCYQIAADSAIRWKNASKANEIATKCFNRGIAFIDQPRIPSKKAYLFIQLAGKTLEDIGLIKDAANAYDNAMLKYLRLITTRKNIEPLVTDLLVKTAVNRMASCDMDSLETIFLRVMELAEMKKSKAPKVIATTLKHIKNTKVSDAWNLIASLPVVSHGRIRKIIDATKRIIIRDLAQKGTFDRTILSTTDRSLPLSDYILQGLEASRKIKGQPINKDVFISLEKLNGIRKHFLSEYDLWGRIDVEGLTQEFAIQFNDAVSIIRREFLSSLYMAIFDNAQRVFYSFDRLKAEISLILNRERKKDTIFDPLQVSNEMKIPPDIIKEVLREITCEKVVEKALET